MKQVNPRLASIHQASAVADSPTRTSGFQESMIEDDSGQKSFITIDDVTDQAQALLNGLKKLGEYKYPFDVRRARKGVMKRMKNIQKNRESKQVRAGSRTYFIDIEEAKNGKRYMRITESRFKGEGSERERASIVVFPEEANKFAQAVSQMVGKLKKK